MAKALLWVQIAIAPTQLCGAAPLQASQAAVDVPSWIWLGTAENDQELVFRKSFELDSVPPAASLACSCDNTMVVLVNGKRVGSHGQWERVVSRDVSEFLQAGSNLLEVRAGNETGPGGLALRLDLGAGRILATDSSWKVALPQRALRNRWTDATVLGAVGAPDLPWSRVVGLEQFLEPAGELSSTPAGAPQAPKIADRIHLPEGFVAELLYTVPNELQGSWVSITDDEQGRLYASDQAGRGIYRITPAELGKADALTTVERVPVEVSGAQGMEWAFDSLYVNVNGQGVWRLTDTDGDDQLDGAKNLIPLGNGGEHGPHALLKTLDGKGLYFIAGNHTDLPEFQGSRGPSNWGEDLLLPRRWDARGHARGKLAPGGWIARCNPDGEEIEVLSTGYRNQYDIALNHAGEMFTYDADMEYDHGSPWYRPTRVCHVTSGSEFGWRSGTGKWPSYWEDSLPSVVDIGPGSPTGIVFGTGAKFPARYQKALFLLDWTFGTIYALHLEPDGATYRADKEQFAWAKPLGVTDAVIGADGCLYFTVGGRGAQSALYRIRYEGEESVAPVVPDGEDAGSAARAQRHSLEAFHGKVDGAALDAAWPDLASPDRHLRFAARIAVESQPIAEWRERALQERDPQAAILALMALARQGEPSDLAPVLSALESLDWSAMEEHQRLGALRTYALAFIRLGRPEGQLRSAVLTRIDGLMPAASDAVNTELARLLIDLGSTSVVEKTLALMRTAPPTPLPEWAELIQRNDTYGGPIAKMLADMPPVQNIQLAFLLRNAIEGWSLPMRREYFEFFVQAAKHPGGASYPGFLEGIRADAMQTLSVAEEHSLAELLGRSLLAPLPEGITQPEGPGREWTHAEAASTLGEDLSARSYDRGQNLFHAASCSTCHRFDGVGGAIGPDLSTVGNKFSIADILEAIVEPSKVISDQYGSHLVVDTDGRIAEGILVEEGDEVTLYSRNMDTPPRTYQRSEIDTISESKLSQMPSGLVDGLNPEELRDLVAYLVAGGDRKSKVFQAAATGEGGR